MTQDLALTQLNHLESILSTSRPRSQLVQETDILRQELQRVHAKVISAATTTNVAFLVRQQGVGTLQFFSKLVLLNAARQSEWEDHDRTEVAEATAQQRRTGPTSCSGLSKSSQQMEKISQMYLLAEDAMQGKRSTLMSEQNSKWRKYIVRWKLTLKRKPVQMTSRQIRHCINVTSLIAIGTRR